jgi:hypothetical protein
MYSCSSFLVTRSTSMLERCGTMKDTNATKAHPIFLWTSIKASSHSTNRCPWRWHETFAQIIRASSTTQLETPNRPPSSHTQILSKGWLLSVRVPMNSRVTSPSMKWRGKSNRLGESVDLGLLTQIPKGLRVLVARMRDLVLSNFATMEERE